MEVIRKINDELAISGPITSQQLKQLAEEGFQSVLNLRSLDRHLRCDEQDYAERLGLCYVNLPIDREVMRPEIADRVLKQIEQLPKPTLLYCNNAMLAAAMVLMQISIRQGATLQQAFNQAEQLELFSLDSEQSSTLIAPRESSRF